MASRSISLLILGNFEDLIIDHWDCIGITHHTIAYNKAIIGLNDMLGVLSHLKTYSFSVAFSDL